MWPGSDHEPYRLPVAFAEPVDHVTVADSQHHHAHTHADEQQPQPDSDDHELRPVSGGWQERARRR